MESDTFYGHVSGPSPGNPPNFPGVGPGFYDFLLLPVDGSFHGASQPGRSPEQRLGLLSLDWVLPEERPKSPSARPRQIRWYRDPHRSHTFVDDGEWLAGDGEWLAGDGPDGTWLVNVIVALVGQIY